jgi:hypothetical protein
LGRTGKQELLHVLKQKLPRFRLSKIQSVVVDQLLLELEPFRPAHRANLMESALAEGSREGRKLLLIAGLLTADACDGCHAER